VANMSETREAQPSRARGGLRGEWGRLAFVPLRASPENVQAGIPGIIYFADPAEAFRSRTYQVLRSSASPPRWAPGSSATRSTRGPNSAASHQFGRLWRWPHSSFGYTASAFGVANCFSRSAMRRSSASSRAESAGSPFGPGGPCRLG